jgi:hypothetical protein
MDCIVYPLDEDNFPNEAKTIGAGLYRKMGMESFLLFYFPQIRDDREGILVPMMGP